MKITEILDRYTGLKQLNESFQHLRNRVERINDVLLDHEHRLTDVEATLRERLPSRDN